MEWLREVIGNFTVESCEMNIQLSALRLIPQRETTEHESFRIQRQQII